MQTTQLFLGLLTFPDHMLFGLGIMLSANEVPQIAQHYGLDTSIKVYFSSAAHNTTMAINAIKAVVKKLFMPFRYWCREQRDVSENLKEKSPGGLLPQGLIHLTK